MFKNNYLNLESVTISFSPFRFQVVALTTTHGNVNEPQVFNNSQKILNVIGRKDVCITNDIVFFLLQTPHRITNMVSNQNSNIKFLSFSNFEQLSNLFVEKRMFPPCDIKKKEFCIVYFDYHNDSTFQVAIIISNFR